MTAVKQRKKQNISKPRVIGKPFQPGQSGNPAGRPKRRTTSEWLKLELLKSSTANSQVSNAETIARKLVELACTGDLKAIKEVFDRTEGRPKQAIEHTVDERRTALIERSLEQFIAEAKEQGIELTREEAAEKLRELVPEFSAYVH